MCVLCLTCIILLVDVSPALAQYMEQVIQVLQQRTVEPILPLDSGGRLHLSLSRPFVLEHADIEDFVQTLRHGFRWKEASVDELWLDGCGIFLNDDLTRSFVSLLVEPKKTREVVIDVISVVDQVLKRFHLPVYYEVCCLICSFTHPPIVHQYESTTESTTPCELWIGLRTYVGSDHTNVRCRGAPGTTTRSDAVSTPKLVFFIDAARLSFFHFSYSLSDWE